MPGKGMHLREAEVEPTVEPPTKPLALYRWRDALRYDQSTLTGG
jgi:hypothetical protein